MATTVQKMIDYLTQLEPDILVVLDEWEAENLPVAGDYVELESILRAVEQEDD